MYFSPNMMSCARVRVEIDLCLWRHTALVLQVVGALSAVAWTAVPMVVSLSTFACYTLLGNELTSAKYVLRIEIARCFYCERACLPVCASLHRHCSCPGQGIYVTGAVQHPTVPYFHVANGDHQHHRGACVSEPNQGTHAV